MWYRAEPFQGWASTKVVIEVATKGTRPKFVQDPVPPVSFIALVERMWQQDHENRPQIAEVQEMWSTVKAEILGKQEAAAAADVVIDGRNDAASVVANPIIEATTRTDRGGDQEKEEDKEPLGDP